MGKLTEIIANIWKKHEGKIGGLSVAAILAGGIAIGESQKIGSYRPKDLSAGYTSYVAYDRGSSIHLYPPFIKGMGHGPIIDKGKDGTIDYVGTLTYPRMPVSFNQLEIGSPEQRQKIRAKYQKTYDNVMAEIRKSTQEFKQ